MLYPILKWLHILAAIVAVGSNMTYPFWFNRAERDPDRLPFTLKSIQVLDRRMANPAYGLLLILGFGMVLTGGLPVTTPWILSALILYVALAVVGALLYSPVIKQQTQVLDSHPAGSPEYQAIARRARMIGILLLIIAVGIVFLMTVKPRLWG